MLNSNIVGNIGELKAVDYLLRLGYFCYTATFGNGPVDLIALKEEKLLKIECKSSNTIVKTKTGDKCNVQLRSVRYNRNKLDSRKFDGSKSDLCFIWVEPFNSMYIYESKNLHGRTGIALRRDTLQLNTTLL